MNYRIVRIRPGFWLLVNLYGETVAECPSLHRAAMLRRTLQALR